MWSQNRCMLLLITVLVLVALGSCNPSVTPTPVATPTALPPFTPHSSVTAIATRTATWTPTATATATPTLTATMTPACPTCPPIQPGLMADVILRTCLDQDDDEQCDSPITATVLFEYDLVLPTGLPRYIQVDTAPQGLVIVHLLPGVHRLILLRYQESDCLVPYEQGVLVIVSAGGQTVYTIRFWRLARCFAMPPLSPTMTPLPVIGTPTATPTPVGSHACVYYYINCVPVAQACPPGQAEDLLGSCGTSFKCCREAP